MSARVRPASIGPRYIRAVEYVSPPLVRICDGADRDDASDRTRYLNDHLSRSAIGEAIMENTNDVRPDSDGQFAGSPCGTGCFFPRATLLRRSKIHQRSNQRDIKIIPVIQPLQTALSFDPEIGVAHHLAP